MDELIEILNQWATRRVMVLTDTNVAGLYPQYFERLSSVFECQTMVVPAGEESKNTEQLIRIWNRMLDFEMDRSDTLILFGGGTVCDMGGFAAATFKRGIHTVSCPTTLLAMIDAAHGGKTGINFGHIKNCIGTVRQPDYMMPANLEFLKTLPAAELKSGFGEMIKYALIASPELFNQLCSIRVLTAETILPEWIERCVAYKRKVVALDPEDRNERHVLNFGHTFGHALESFYLLEGMPVTHGEAVAIGMVYESRLSVRHAGLSQVQFNRINELICRFYDVPEWSEDLIKSLRPYLLQDKKNSSGELNFTLLCDIGNAMINNFIQIF